MKKILIKGKTKESMDNEYMIKWGKNNNRNSYPQITKQN